MFSLVNVIYPNTSSFCFSSLSAEFDVGQLVWSDREYYPIKRKARYMKLAWNIITNLQWYIYIYACKSLFAICNLRSSSISNNAVCKRWKETCPVCIFLNLVQLLSKFRHIIMHRSQQLFWELLKFHTLFHIESQSGRDRCRAHMFSRWDRVIVTDWHDTKNVHFQWVISHCNV